MPKIKEMLKNGDIFLKFDSENARKKFITDAVREGLSWANGKPVSPGDECFFYVIITADGRVSNIPSFARREIGSGTFRKYTQIE